MKRFFRLELRTRFGGAKFFFITHDEYRDINLVSFFCQWVSNYCDTLDEIRYVYTKFGPTIRVVEWNKETDKKQPKGIQFTTKWR